MRATPQAAQRAGESSSAGTYRVGPPIKDLPLAARPRERLEQLGAGSLSDMELLAIILRTGSTRQSALALAENVIGSYQGLPGVDRATLAELRQVHGLGKVKVIEIKAAFELGKRLALLQPEQRVRIGSPDDIFQLLRGAMAHLEQEELRVLLLSTKNEVLRVFLQYRGTLNSTNVRLGELFREAIRDNAAHVILAHNHPSGDPTPSPQDVSLTRDAIQAGSFLGIDVLDHVVIGQGQGRDGFVSLKERGLAFDGQR